MSHAPPVGFWPLGVVDRHGLDREAERAHEVGDAWPARVLENDAVAWSEL
jgi:hypothetical protein